MSLYILQTFVSLYERLWFKVERDLERKSKKEKESYNSRKNEGLGNILDRVGEREGRYGEDSHVVGEGRKKYFFVIFWVSPDG